VTFAQDGLDRAPLRFHQVLAGKELTLPPHGVAHQSLVGRHVVGAPFSNSSTSRPVIRSPGVFTRTPIPMAMSGLMRMRRCTEVPGTISPKVSIGGRLNSTKTSVAVTGSILAARI